MRRAEALSIDLKVSYKVANTAFYVPADGGDCPLKVIAIQHIKKKRTEIFMFLCFFVLQILPPCLSSSEFVRN